MGREVIGTKQVAKPYTVEVPRAVPVPTPYKVHPVHEVVEQPIVHHATYTQTHTAHVAAPVAVAHAAPLAVAHAAPAVAAAPVAVAHAAPVAAVAHAAPAVAVHGVAQAAGPLVAGAHVSHDWGAQW